MAPSWSTAAKSDRMNASLARIDGNGPATLEIGSLNMAQVLVVIPLATPSFTQTNGVLTLAFPPHSGTAALTGTAAAARIKDGGGNIVLDKLTVSTSNADIILNSTAIRNFQPVTINTFTIAHSP